MTVDSFKYLKLPVALLTAMLTVSLPSYATVVLPTQTVIPGALTSAAGTLLAAEAAPFTAISYSGVLRAAVYLNPNPTEVCPAGNCLDFYY
jgi:ABC-type sulfate transport system permease component